jgi:hypothetical protein
MHICHFLTFVAQGSFTTRFGLAAPTAANRLFLLNTAQLALGNKPAFAAHSTQNPTLGYLLAEAAEQLFLRLIRAQLD